MFRQLSFLTGIGILAICMSAGAATSSSGPKLYKWVDKNGVVHYGDHIPDTYLNDAHQTLNDQGVVLKNAPGEKTRQELAAEAKLHKQKMARERAAQKRRQYDQMLLDSYNSVADMERARDNQLNALSAQIKLYSGTVSASQQNVETLENRVDRLKKHSKPVPQSLATELADARQDLLQNKRFILDREQEKKAIKARFARDIARYKELAESQNDPGS